MKQLILDYFRRWWWMFALGAGLELRRGWFIAHRPEDPFEFWIFSQTLWLGALLLSIDLRRGVVRTVAVLPLTGRQIGRSWWLETVAIPGIGLAAMLFFGAGTFCHFHPNQEFPADRLTLASLFTLVWLGISFTLIGCGTCGFYGKGWKSLGNFFLTALAVLTFFGGMVFGQDASTNPSQCAAFLGVGAVLTLVGRHRAEQFDLGRAGLWHSGGRGPTYPVRAGVHLTPLEPRIAKIEPAPESYGGMLFWFRTTFVRQVSLGQPELPFSLFGLIAGISVPLAFLLTRHVILHGSEAYRARANPFGEFPGPRAGDRDHVLG